MIKFAKERVNLICNQLKGWSIVQKVHLDSMRVKEGCFITPTEADAAPGEWKNFDMGKDHWYQGEKKGRNRSQESRHSCGGYCKGRVRSGQQFTAERAAERNADCVNIACR